MQKLPPIPRWLQILLCICSRENPTSEAAEQAQKRAQRRADAARGLIRTREAPTSRITFPRTSLTPPSLLVPHLDAPTPNKSALLSLPLELRQAIWKEALGGMRLHLNIRYMPNFAQHQLGYFVCRSPQDREMCGRETLCWLYQGRDKFAGPKPLHLILTCHQV